MGLFDGFKSKIEPAFDPQKAVMTIVVSSVMADGDASDEEISRLRSMCARSPIFASNSKEQDNAVIDFACNLCSQLGKEAISKAALALSKDLKETAFAYAIEVVLSDGIVGEDEEEFITTLSEKLSISKDVAQAIILTTIIRARGI